MGDVNSLPGSRAPSLATLQAEAAEAAGAKATHRAQVRRAAALDGLDAGPLSAADAGPLPAPLPAHAGKVDAQVLANYASMHDRRLAALQQTPAGAPGTPVQITLPKGTSTAELAAAVGPIVGQQIANFNAALNGNSLTAAFLRAQLDEKAYGAKNLQALIKGLGASRDALQDQEIKKQKEAQKKAEEAEKKAHRRGFLGKLISAITMIFAAILAVVTLGMGTALLVLAAMATAFIAAGTAKGLKEGSGFDFGFACTIAGAVGGVGAIGGAIAEGAVEATLAVASRTAQEAAATTVEKSAETAAKAASSSAARGTAADASAVDAGAAAADAGATAAAQGATDVAQQAASSTARTIARAAARNKPTPAAAAADVSGEENAAAAAARAAGPGLGQRMARGMVSGLAKATGTTLGSGAKAGAEAVQNAMQGGSWAKSVQGLAGARLVTGMSPTFIVAGTMVTELALNLANAYMTEQVALAQNKVDKAQAEAEGYDVLAKVQSQTYDVVIDFLQRGVTQQHNDDMQAAMRVLNLKNAALQAVILNTGS